MEACHTHTAMEVLSKHRTLLIGLAGVGATMAVTWLFLSRGKKKHVRKVGEVSQLFLYPVKSCKGVPLQEAECRDYGLKNGELRDRHWLVVKEDKVHVTARQEPRMVLITVTCDRGHLTLSAPGMNKLDIPLKLLTSNAIFTCKVHGNEVSGRDCGDEASRWITNFLKSVQTYRIVQFEDRMKRRNPKNEYPVYNENDQVAYPDLSPLLLLSEASLEDLNSKLENKVSIRNFRPNIVVSGCGAFAEDSWKEIQIAERVMLKRVMPCPRCILTTVDPDTGIINMKEPLETMRSYRLCDTADKEVYKSSPLFGQFVRIQKTGTIKVGDPVYEIFY
ncbi:PREDICTED: mitochondrial amidoxime-reducing component 1 [Nanorana parkeri]|uniref:mitochondrial amidoxime-reducing component 1 n=1 Tax=Nanorana parkeri TaxID=125878 RepID=UPI00085464DD|nr:PREDICTED: mitochondrial amidoxime-reducing component 1 [Nanorana parkeri]